MKNAEFLIVSTGDFAKNKLNRMLSAITHSTMFKALKTIRPIPNPNGRVIPGARNFSQASIKLIALTNPIHMNVQMAATGSLTVLIVMVLMRFSDSIGSWCGTFPPCVLPAIWHVLLSLL